MNVRTILRHRLSIDACLSLRSTGERLSNVRLGSLRIAFQLPTPHLHTNMNVNFIIEKNDLGAYSVAAAHEHLRLLLCPFLALALLWHWCPCGTMFVFVGRDFAHLASLFWDEW